MQRQGEHKPYRFWIDSRFLETLENAVEALHERAIEIRNLHYNGREWDRRSNHKAYIDTMMDVLKIRARVDIHVV